MDVFESFEVFINGVAETGPSCTIAELVVRKGLTSRALVVLLNEQSIKRDQWSSVPLHAGDLSSQSA